MSRKSRKKDKSSQSKNRSSSQQGQSGDGQARRAIDLAHEHFRRTLRAAREAAPKRPAIPAVIIKHPVRRSVKNPRTREEWQRMKAERDGYDPGLGRWFRTQWEAEEYRKRKGIVQMSASEFNSEVGDAPSPASEPYYSYLDRIPFLRKPDTNQELNIRIDRIPGGTDIVEPD